MSKVTAKTIANFAPRVIGSIIDLILVVIISAIIIFVWAYIVGMSGSESHMSRQASEVLWEGRGVLVGLLVDMTYTIWLQAGSNGATFGQKSMGLQLVTLKYEKPTLVALILRYFMSLVSSIFLKIGFLIALFSDKKQTLHDMVAGTIVVHTSGNLNPYKTHSANNESNPNTQRASPDEKNLIKYGEDIIEHIDQEYWAKAYEELDGNVDTGTWARVYATANGNESIAKAQYLKIRAAHFQRLQSDKEKIEDSNEGIIDSDMNNIGFSSSDSKLPLSKKIIVLLKDWLRIPGP